MGNLSVIEREADKSYERAHSPLSVNGDLILGFTKILNVFLLLASVSFIFYFVGCLDRAAYFATLGLGALVPDTSYEHYVVIGVLDLFIFSIYVPIFYDWYKRFDDIKKLEQELVETQGFIDRSRMVRGDTAEMEKLKVLLDRLEVQTASMKQRSQGKRERFLSKSPFKILGGFFSVLMMLIIIITLAFSFNYQTAILSVLVQNFAGVAVAMYFSHYLKRLLGDPRKVGNSSQVIYWFLVFLLILWPICIGFLEGQRQLHVGNFTKVSIITRDESILNADLVAQRKEIYVLRADNKYKLIPTAEIKKIELNAVQGEPFLYSWWYRIKSFLHDSIY